MGSTTARTRVQFPAMADLLLSIQAVPAAYLVSYSNGSDGCFPVVEAAGE
jgi:hypothetical protein